jgi:hypothetical protein
MRVPRASRNVFLGNIMAEATTVTTSTTATGPEPGLSWLDKAVADATSVLERIHTDARAALDTISPETAEVVRVHAEPGSSE